MTRLSDSHSIEYEFTGLDLELEGLRFCEVSGTAELTLNDQSEGDFYVSHVVLSVMRPVPISPVTNLGIWRPSIKQLYRSDRCATDLSAHLFRLIEAALYKDEGAKEAWRAELEEA